MAEYYAIYERRPTGKIGLPGREGDGQLFPGRNPFASTEADETNLPAREGDATLYPGIAPWASNEAATVNLPRHEGDATLFPGRNSWTSDDADVVNLPTREGDATLLGGIAPWSSDSLGESNLTATEGDATLFPGRSSWTSDAVDVSNLSATEGDATIFPGRNGWTSDAVDGLNLPNTEGDATLYPGINSWVSVTPTETNLPNTEGDSTLRPGVNSWSSDAAGDINLPQTEGDATKLPGENEWTSPSATEVNLNNTEGDATQRPGENAFSTDTSGDINLPQTEGDATHLPGENAWSSSSLGEINLPRTEGDATIDVGENAWTSDVSGSLNLNATEGDATHLPGENAWTTDESDAINLSRTEGDATQVPGENAWSSVGASERNLNATEGDATLQPGENAFATSGTDVINLPQREGDGELEPGENIFFTETTGPPSDAACFLGSVTNPAYLATGTFAGAYNPVQYGYISLYYKYEGTDPFLDFPDGEDNILFTVWGDTEGDRLEFGIIAGIDQPLDLFTKASSGLGFDKVRAILATDIADGQWHHLMFGGGQGSWWFFVDGTRITATLNDVGRNTGEWFLDIQEAGDHELTVAATRVSGAINGTSYLNGCIDELMVVNNRNYLDNPNDPVYLNNGGDGSRIPEVETDNPDGLWDDVYNAWRLRSGNVGEEYKDGIFNFDIVVGDSPTDGIVGRLPFAAINTYETTQPRAGLIVDYAVKTIPPHNGFLTFATWIKLDNTSPPTNAGIATKFYGGANEWALYYDNVNRLFRALAWSPSGTMFVSQPSYATGADIWYFLALRVGHLTQGLQISIGSQFASLAHGTPGPSYQTNDGVGSILLGMYNYDQDMLSGAMDDTMYWNRVLSDAELEQLFDGGAGLPFDSWTAGLQNSLIMHFSMDEEIGSRADSWGDNIGSDGKRFIAQPIPSKEPLTVQGHVT